jgi:hypothetical protein
MTHLSRLINTTVLSWGSPIGVLATLLVCTAGHIALTVIGYLKTPPEHYIAGLSELAIIGTALILHSSIVGDKAAQLKLDGLVRGIEAVSDELVAAEELPEREMDILRKNLRE